MNSITESVYSGTPMIVIPLFADQEHNAAAVVARNIGINVKKTTLHDPTALRKAISDILTDQKYGKIFNFCNYWHKSPLSRIDLLNLLNIHMPSQFGHS